VNPAGRVREAMDRSQFLGRGALGGSAMLLAVTAAGGGSAAPGAPVEAPGLRVHKPVADTYVTAARPLANFGRLQLLRVDGAPETTAYLRFRLKKIPGEIASVTLLLHSRSASRASYAVRRVTGDVWSERRLTYANAPECSLRYASARVERRGTWTAIDVTPFVDAAGREISLAITTRGSRQLSFSSRESHDAPRLVVRFASGDHSEDRVLDSRRRRYPD
jgi:hypothetical protein